MKLPEQITFKSYCWVLGTTSFRVAQMSLGIEQQLIHLRDFREEYQSTGAEWRWAGNNALQEEFYYYLQRHGALTGSARLPDKDARQKTSGLEMLGLIDSDRAASEVGYELLALTERGSFASENFLMLSADSFIYFKQLLKTSIVLPSGEAIRPYLVLAYLLYKFEALSFDEFRYLVPLVIDHSSLSLVIAGIEKLRRGGASIESIIFEILSSKENYRAAQRLWMDNVVDENLVVAVGMNRKSRSYDKKYAPLYFQLRRIFVEGDQSAESALALFTAIDSVSPTVARHWKRDLFTETRQSAIRAEGFQALSTSSEFYYVESEKDLKRAFFRALHLFKAKATLEDYFDLNRRYIKLTDTVLFHDQKIQFDTLPKAYFTIIGEDLLFEMFVSSRSQTSSCSLSEISKIFDVPASRVLGELSSSTGVAIDSLKRAKEFVKDERYERLHELLDTRFTKGVLIELLECFSKRMDSRIAELVTDAATPSTIFEYVLALIWYEFSGRSGDVLEYMKLTLEADLLPRTHAQGGSADIVYEYEPNSSFPAHSMLIEATLADGSNSRKMEMEPVSRHLGNYILDSGNYSDYCVFVAPTIDFNVANDFRGRKQIGFWNADSSEQVPLKIIPLDIPQVVQLLELDFSYPELYAAFDVAYRSNEVNPKAWRAEISALLSR